MLQETKKSLELQVPVGKGTGNNGLCGEALPQNGYLFRDGGFKTGFVLLLEVLKKP